MLLSVVCWVLRNSHLTTDTNGLVEGVGELLIAKLVDGLAEDLVGEAGVVAEAGDRVADVALAGDTHALARVERLDSGDLVRVTLEEVGEFVQDCD